MKRLLILASFAACAVAHADDAAEREQIERQRTAIEAEHVRREQTCRQQFVVTECLEKARKDRLKALKLLRSQEISLDDAQRRARSQAQVERLEKKKAEAAQKRDPPKVPAPPKQPREKKVEAARPHAPKASAPDRSAIEKQRREAFEARQREIREHRESVEKRNAERAGRKPAKPLPVPASASPP